MDGYPQSDPPSYGAGVFNWASTLTIRNSTIVRNAAAYLGGVYSWTDPYTLTNSIVAQNTGGNADNWLTPESGYNLI